MKRNCNKIADALAKKSRVGLELQVWVEDLPGDIIPHWSLTDWFLKKKKKTNNLYTFEFGMRDVKLE